MIKFSSLYFALFILSLNAQTLSLQECIDKTIHNHPDIKSSALVISQAKTMTTIMQAGYLPQIALNAEYDPLRTYALPANGLFRTIESDNFQVAAVLNQKIWDFSKTSSTIKAYEKAESIAKLSLKENEALIVFNVKVQYGLMLVHKKALEVREQELKAKEELYKQAKALVREGIKTSADASSFLSALYIAKDNLAIAQANFNKAKSTLSLYINEDISPDIILEENILSPKDLDKEFAQDTLLKNILLQSPKLQRSAQEITKSELLYKATKASHYGSLDAIASYTYVNSLNEYDSTLLGVTLNIPLYSGGKISAQAQQAKLAKEYAKEIYNSKELSLRAELQALLIDIQRYKSTIQAKKSLIHSAEATKKVLQARYKEGLSTYIEVLDATSTYYDARLGLLQAKFDRANIMNRLDYLQGKIK